MRTIKVSACLQVLSVAIFFLTTGLLVWANFPSSFQSGGLRNTKKQPQIVKKAPSKGSGSPPVLAYSISGTQGDNQRILRLVKAVYHPRNQYLLHLDAGSSSWERNKLALSVLSEREFRAFGNVDIVGKAYPVNQMGSSAIAAVLHAAAVLLKINKDWDWLITLSASDYPIVSQDDLLHVFSPLPRNLNFIHHTNSIGWKESQRINQIVIDPNLYMAANTPIFQVRETRETPDALKIFTGSPWSILSRPFVEYTVHGWDNLPRKLLMYFSNVAFPLETYFQTILCNSPDFRNTTVNSDLKYAVWDTPPQLVSQFLSKSNYKEIVSSGAAFARRFREGDPVLQKVDEYILMRPMDGIVPGKWCFRPSSNESKKGLQEDPCSYWGDIDAIEPGPQAEKLQNLVSKLVAEKSRWGQCNLR
ncbi:beta-glucuronosyltransferase GlcAT14A-like [Aristolochia californica]|uniref:beta-glucuronosyltransferase GlcAT14A-like n=1 Tax=Aristolochia californica TaxID=171875 RepID=UPI0035DD4B53